MIHVGDCLEVMRTLDAASVDSIVTDPPYGLGFMGKAWDHAVPGAPFWTEMLRVAKPGAYLVAFGGTRTFHRMACAIEDAGWEIRDTAMWVYGSGFPKSHNGEWGGTALKPAWEPIIMARKPFKGTVEANWREHGTGALNIDGCRVPADAGDVVTFDRHAGDRGRDQYRTGTVANARPSEIGRWPANLIHDGSEEVVALFPQSNGQQGDLVGHYRDRASKNTYGDMRAARDALARGDSGSAARFFAQHQLSDEDWLWQHLSLAPTEGSSFALQNDRVVSALSGAATLALPGGTLCAVARAPSTSATASELRRLATALIETIQRTASACWLGQRQGERSRSASHVRAVVAHEPTGTTTITVSHWKSDGSAEPVTFSITATNSEAGAKDSRFRYCAKADRADRNDGCDGMAERPLLWSSGAQSPGTFQAEGTRRASENNHPTVKPTDLMRWLCRLVTPAEGLVLDPFAGSGSTGRGAIAEGFQFVGIELDPEYARIAEARIRAVQPGLPLEAIA